MHLLVPTFSFLLFLLLVDNGEPRKPVYILESGLEQLKVNGIGLVFYINIMNELSKNVSVEVLMDQCCLILEKTVSDIDCRSMFLTSEPEKILANHEKYKFSLIFPNVYVTDRVGQCNLIINTNASHEGAFRFEHLIAFDTTVPQSPAYCEWIPPNIRDYVVGTMPMNCNGFDEDRLRKCAPVDCILKYNGNRSYFNATSRRCEPVPVCEDISKDDAALPTMAYDRVKNRCKNLSSVINEKDAADIQASESNTNYEEYRPSSSFKCVHGNFYEGRCICNNGWIDGFLDPWNVELEKDMHLCNEQEELTVYLAGFKWDIKVDVALVLCGASAALLLTLIGITSYESYLTSVKTKKQYKASLDSLASSLGINNNNGNHKGRSHRDNSSDVVFGYAVVHTESNPVADDELELHMGQVISNLRPINIPGMMEGISDGLKGVFPLSKVNIHTLCTLSDTSAEDE